MKLDLNDLKPEESTFELSGFPGKVLTLKKFSLNAQIWCHEKFGKDAIKGIFENQRLPEISELVFYLLKEKEVVSSLDVLREAVYTAKDREALLMSLLKTIGISQPVIQKLANESAQGNEQSLSLPTGAQSTTP